MCIAHVECHGTRKIGWYNVKNVIIGLIKVALLLRKLFFRQNIQSGHVRSADIGNNYLLIYSTKKAI